MSANILDVITDHYLKFTRSEKKLADYIFSNTTNTQYLSISALAENSGVSEATITRFCKKLALSGYNEFKLALAKAEYTADIVEHISIPQPITSEDHLGNICQKLFSSNVASLNETYELLDEQAVRKAVDILAGAERVYCFGHGGSSVVAMEAWARFSTISSHFIHISDSHLQVMAASLATPQDAFLFFSYSGSTRDMKSLLEIARNRKTPVILITHFARSLAASYADVVLLCGYNESPTQSGSIAAKVGQLFLIECLFYGYFMKNPERSNQARFLTAEAVAKKLL